MPAASRTVALVGALLLAWTVAVPAASAPAWIEEGHYRGHDTAEHPITFIALHHRVGHFEYGVHHQHARGTTEIHHGVFSDCFDHLCVVGQWHGGDRVFGAWRHHDPHHPHEQHPSHQFVAHLVR